MKKICLRIVAIAIAMSMIVSLLPVMSFAGEAKTKNYLFMGDSMSYNFVNDRHYYTKDLDKYGHYPAQIADYFGYNCMNELGSSVFTLGGG